MRILLVFVGLVCFTSCGMKQKKDATVHVVNDSTEQVVINVTGNYEVEDISRKLTIPPQFTANHSWEYKVKKKPGNDVSGDYDIELTARRPNNAILMWKKLTNASAEDLRLNIHCDDRNCRLE